jgi:transcriptional/translational regulatory protein YebC/TACO1
VKATDDTFEVYTSPGDLSGVVEALEVAGIKTISSQVTMVPNTTVKLEGKDAQQMLRMLDILEDHDDIQNVYANFDIPDEVLEAAAR